MWKKLKEVEAFNASKLSTKVKDHGERSARTLKEKRARCYICKIRGHVFWKCPNKKREAMIEQQKKLVKPTVKKIEERVKYPEKVHIITDYMVEGTDDASWDRIWYVSSAYKQHMCPTKTLFKNLKHKFRMVGKEETERKFIFSYGVGEVTVDTRDRNLVIPCVLYTPETTLNVLSIDQLEDQGYIVKYNNNKCSLHYMFDEARTKITQEEETKEDDGSENVVAEHNKYLDEYFESIDPKEDCSLVKGLEDLKWDRNDVHDYVDEEYISWNGSLYALKVNSFTRLYKMVDSLGGYLSVTLGNKWKKVVELHGLTEDDEEAIKKCYKKFIEMVQVYYETAEKPWHEKKPVENVVDSSIGYDRGKGPRAVRRQVLEWERHWKEL
ncbi:ARID DNA-binding domain-containing protein [Tanacetum coccineum]